MNDSNITVNSNIYIVSGEKSADRQFLSQVRDRQALKHLLTYNIIRRKDFTEVQENIYSESLKCIYNDPGDFTYGPVKKENGELRWECRCCEVECVGFKQCRKDFQVEELKYIRKPNIVARYINKNLPQNSKETEEDVIEEVAATIEAVKTAEQTYTEVDKEEGIEESMDVPEEVEYMYRQDISPFEIVEWLKELEDKMVQLPLCYKISEENLNKYMSKKGTILFLCYEYEQAAKLSNYLFYNNIKNDINNSDKYLPEWLWGILRGKKSVSREEFESLFELEYDELDNKYIQNSWNILREIDKENGIDLDVKHLIQNMKNKEEMWGKLGDKPSRIKIAYSKKIPKKEYDHVVIVQYDSWRFEELGAEQLEAVYTQCKHSKQIFTTQFNKHKYNKDERKSSESFYLEKKHLDMSSFCNLSIQEIIAEAVSIGEEVLLRRENSVSEVYEIVYYDIVIGKMNRTFYKKLQKCWEKKYEKELVDSTYLPSEISGITIGKKVTVITEDNELILGVSLQGEVSIMGRYS